MSSERGPTAIAATGVSKAFVTYPRPSRRLVQMGLNFLASFAPASLKRWLHAKAATQGHVHWALRDVSINVDRGETVGIVGRNGSGKSTLLQILCGTLTPTSGDIDVTGRVAALLELGAGFNPEYTGRENVYMNAQVHGLSREQTDARMDEILAFAEIGDFIDEPVKTYSSGMYVRLAFAVIAHVDAEILIIDEALAVGDAMFTHKCMRFLRAFMRKGTVLFVSHDTSAIKSLCSRAIWIEKGTKLMEGSPKEICDLYLQAFYEEQQGKSSTTVLKKDFAAAKPVEWRDQRLDFISRSDYRNDIRVFEFDPNAQSFGAGGAKIRDAHIADSQGQPLSYIVGGETVVLRVTIEVSEDLSSPIVGFYVKDRLGQTLFGDNTYITYVDAPVPVGAGQDLVAEFEFPMPILLVGSYSIHLAVADGTQQEHVQQHFFHDALLLQSEASSRVNGLVGIPMRRIELVVQPHPTLAVQ